MLNSKCLLVGGLEHEFYFPIYWVANHPNWRSYFSEGWPNHQPVMLHNVERTVVFKTLVDALLKRRSDGAQAARGAAGASRLAAPGTGEGGARKKLMWHSQHQSASVSISQHQSAQSAQLQFHFSVHSISLLSFHIVHFDCWTPQSVSDQGGCWCCQTFARHGTCRRSLPRLNRMCKKDLDSYTKPVVSGNHWKSKSHKFNRIHRQGRKATSSAGSTDCDDPWPVLTVCFDWEVACMKVCELEPRGLRSGIWTHHWRGLAGCRSVDAEIGNYLSNLSYVVLFTPRCG